VSDIEEGSALSKTKEETSKAQPSMMVIHLDWLASYEGTARDEQP
jgi:hypothetical protein